MKKILSLITILSLIVTAMVPTFASDNNDYKNYMNAISKVQQDENIHPELKQALIEEITDRYQSLNDSKKETKMLVTTKSSTSWTKLSTIESSIEELRRTSSKLVVAGNDLTVAGGLACIFKAPKIGVPLVIAGGITYASGRFGEISVEDFTDDTIYEANVYMRWTNESSYEYEMYVKWEYSIYGDKIESGKSSTWEGDFNE